MKSTFRGYIRPTNEELKALWNNAYFSFDANVLLNVYRLNKTASDAFITSLEHLKDRIWLTNQAAGEFFKHYQKEILAQLEAYEPLKHFLSNFPKALRAELPRHSHIPIDDYVEKTQAFTSKLIEDLDRIHATHSSPLDNDPLLTALLTLFDKKVGPPINEDGLLAYQKEAEKRYDKKIPPGFEDEKKKKDERKYGDAILWFQLLDFAKSKSTPIVFVTDDSKDDWWFKHRGKTIGPHPLLCQEMYNTTGQIFYAYPMHRFVEEALKHFDSNSQQSVSIVQDIQEVEAERSNPQQPTNQEINEQIQNEAAMPLERLIILQGKKELLIHKINEIESRLKTLSNEKTMGGINWSAEKSKLLFQLPQRLNESKRRLSQVLSEISFLSSYLKQTFSGQ